MAEGQNFIENELIILTKQTLDKFLSAENPADLIALYTFYYYTAKWQMTNELKATTTYTADGLKWGKDKVRKVKKQLVEYGLIEDVQQRDASSKIIGHYIKLNYIFKNTTVMEIANHPTKKPECGGVHSMAKTEVNALSNNNKNALSDIIKTIVAYLNEKVQPTRPYRATTKATQKHINARLSEGYTLDDFKVVIDKKVDEWKGTEMEQYLRPETLFCAKHFESYLNAKINKKQVVKKTAIIGGTDIARREYGTDKMNSLFSAIDDEEE